MGDRQPIYIEMSETLAEKLEKRIEELDTTKRDYFEEFVREDTEHITLDDPRAELAGIERQLQDAQDELEGIRGEEKELRDSIKALEQKREELEDRVDEGGIVTATSYDEAVEVLIDRAVDDGIAETGTSVERVAEEWGRDPRAVCRDVYERSLRVLERDVVVKGRFPSNEVPDDWKKEWPEYEEAVGAISSRVLSEGVLSGKSSVEVKMIGEQYNEEFVTVAGDVLNEIDVDVAVVETEIGEEPSPEDAPEAGLVVDDYVGDELGLD